MSAEIHSWTTIYDYYYADDYKLRRPYSSKSDDNCIIHKGIKMQRSFYWGRMSVRGVDKIEATLSLSKSTRSAKSFKLIADQVRNVLQERLAGLVKEQDDAEMYLHKDSSKVCVYPLYRDSDSPNSIIRAMPPPRTKSVTIITIPTIVLDVMADLCKCKTLTDLKKFVAKYTDPYSVSPSDQRLADFKIHKIVSHLLRHEKYAEVLQVVIRHRKDTLSPKEIEGFVKKEFSFFTLVLNGLVNDHDAAKGVAPLYHYFKDQNNWVIYSPGLPEEQLRTREVHRLLARIGYVNTYNALVKAGHLAPIDSFSTIMNYCLSGAYLSPDPKDYWRDIRHVNWDYKRVAYFAEFWLRDHLRQKPSTFSKDLFAWALSSRGMDDKFLIPQGMLKNKSVIITSAQKKYRLLGKKAYAKDFNTAFSPVIDFIDKIIAHWSQQEVKEKLRVQKWLFQSVLGRVGGARPTIKEFREKWDQIPLLSFTKKKGARNEFAKKWITRLYEPTSMPVDQHMVPSSTRATSKVPSSTKASDSKLKEESPATSKVPTFFPMFDFSEVAGQSVSFDPATFNMVGHVPMGGC